MKIRSDSAAHFGVSALLVVILGLLLPWWGAAAGALAIGIGKELYDKKHGGVASWHDVICDLAGIALGVLIVCVYHSLIIS